MVNIDKMEEPPTFTPEENRKLKSLPVTQMNTE